MIQKIAAILQDNLGQRLTVALANGLLVEIEKIFEAERAKSSQGGVSPCE